MSELPRRLTRRAFLGRGALAASLGAAGCRAPAGRGSLTLRLSHSMAAGRTALHVWAELFRELAEGATDGALRIRVFPSGTLGQEREVVQQVQEGLVDFMVSGTAIWGSVAPRVQFFDFPFLWRDADHVHAVVDGSVGEEAAAYMERAVRVRPLAFSDSFGFRQVFTRSRDVTEPAHLAGLKIRTIQSAIYVKAVELMGGSATPMAFGEVYTSLETGVIDGYEHDASTTLQQRFHEVAGFMARTRHIAGILGLFASSAGLARVPPPLVPKLLEAAREAARRHRAMGLAEETEAMAELQARKMTIRDLDPAVFLPKAEVLWQEQAKSLEVGRWLQVARG